MATDEQKAPQDHLGDCIEMFRATKGNIIAGFILSALMVAGGVAAIGFPLHAAYLADWNLPVDVKKGWSWLAVGLGCLTGIGLLVGGIVLAGFSRGLMSQCVQICVNGFRYCKRRSTECILWTDIARIRETNLYEQPPVLKGPAKLLLPKFASTSYTVVTVAGKEYGFNGTSINGIKRFGTVLREQAERLSLPWETIEEHA